MKKAVHPAGFNIFGKVSLATLVSAKLETTGASLGGGYTADTDTFSPILASTFEIVFQEQVSKNHLAITRPVAGYDDKLVLETDNPVGDLALEAATASSEAQRLLGINIDPTGRLISETETLFGDRVLLETSSPGNPLYLILETNDRMVYESAVSVTFNLALEPPNTLNGGDFLPGGAVPATSTLVLEDAVASSNHNTGDKLELETGTPHCGRENSFFTFDVSIKDRVLDEDGANQYLETAGVGYRNTAGERGLVISRVVAKINLPNKNVNSIPNAAVFLGENLFDNELGSLSLEIGTVGGSKSGSLLTNATSQINTKVGVDRIIPATFGDKFLLESKSDSNVGSGVTFRSFGEYVNDNLVLDGSDTSGSNAGDNILLEAGTLTDSTHANKEPAMVATDVLIGEIRLVQSFQKIRDIIRPPRLVAVKDGGEVVNIVSEHIGSSGNEAVSSAAGSIKLEDSLLTESKGNLLLEIDGPIGNKYALESNPSFLVPEDTTSNQNKGVVPLENFEARGPRSTMNVSSVLNIEPLRYASDISKRPLGALSVESVGVGKIHIQLEDSTIGIANGSHRPAGTGFLLANGTNTAGLNAGERLEMEPTPGISEFGHGHGAIALDRAPMGNNNNIGERLILESATIFNYVGNTDAIEEITSVENSFDSSSIRFDSGLKTFDLNF